VRARCTSNIDTTGLVPTIKVFACIRAVAGLVIKFTAFRERALRSSFRYLLRPLLAGCSLAAVMGLSTLIPSSRRTDKALKLM
jgi:hypothetical protein